MVGQFGNKRVGAIIQARFDSSRLPGKVLLPISFNGRRFSLLEFIVHRLREVLAIDKVIIATSSEEIDKVIVKEAKRIGCYYYCGDKNDVLKRFFDTADFFQCDVIIRVTGDNPLIMTHEIEQALKEHLDGDYDYSRNNGLPIGSSFEIINKQILQRIISSDCSLEEKEHVTLYVKNHKALFKINERDLSGYDELLKFRFTVDYPSDYAFIYHLISEVSLVQDSISPVSINNYLSGYKWMAELNKNNLQKRQFESDFDEIKSAKKILEDLGFNKALNFFNKNT